jgi:HlyD family secretion protein
MDIRREKNKFQKYTKKLMAAAVVMILAIGGYAVNSSVRPATMIVDRQLLLTDSVQNGDMSMRVLGHGKLIPKQILWVSAQSEGKVESLYVKPGSEVAKGQLMVSLSNLDLQREVQEQQWNREALIAEHDAKRASLETLWLNQKNAVLKAKYEYSSISLELKAQKRLLDQGNGTVSEVEHIKTKLLSEQLHEIWLNEQEKLTKLKLENNATLQAMSSRVEQLNKALEYKRHQLAALEIVSDAAGVVQEVVPQIGERVAAGTSLVKIVNPQDVIAQIEVPEVQASLISFGQAVNLDLRTSKVSGKVTRIDPAVSNGTVKIEVEFDSLNANGVRPDLSVEGEIVIDELSQVNFIRRPSFSQENKVAKVYVLVPNSDRAIKTEVKFGMSSVDRIQVVSGLSPGDVVILNNPTPWLAYDEIQIK